MVLLDTSAVSAIMHRFPAALGRLQRSTPDAFLLSSPVAAEIHYGLNRLAANGRRQRLLAEEYRLLREAVGWADWNEAAAEEFGRQKALLERKGTRLDDMDIAIAAVALTLDAAVATLNVRHFSRIEGLAVEDWTMEAPSS